jgi:hypothetical protein
MARIFTTQDTEEEISHEEAQKAQNQMTRLAAAFVFLFELLVPFCGLFFPLCRLW